MNIDQSIDGPAKGRFRIHPGVGIARIGNSPNDFYIGPEAPNWNPPPVDNLYKDLDGLVKRQAARFRVYEYDANGNVIREMNHKNSLIVWTVTIANKKGSWYQFKGEEAWKDPSRRILRNLKIEPSIQPDQRQSLNITPSAKTVEGRSAGPLRFDDGYFLGQPVGLGEIRTDDAGHLLVLGGDGYSASVQSNNPITDYANNDGWYDNISDGWVDAVIHLPNETSCIAERASVIIAPPAFVPQLHSLVTLDDQMQEISYAQGWLKNKLDRVCFYRDIYPLLVRTSNLAWVSGPAFRGHGSGTHGSFVDQKHISIYSDPSSAAQERRQKLFSILRSPDMQVHDYLSSEGAGLMPLLYGSQGVDEGEKPRNWFSLLPSQYARMKAWAEGSFTVDSPITPCELENYPLADQPNALDRSALQHCAGGPFYPGIEVTFIATHAASWRAPYRIASQWQPGDITKWMAVPWQSDFYECAIHWWPIQRPDAVLTQESFSRQMFGERHSWTRGLSEQKPQGNNEMVNYWSTLGFVKPVKIEGSDIFVEHERSSSKWPHDL